MSWWQVGLAFLGMFVCALILCALLFRDPYK